jgi:hypothetical protein
VDSILFMMNLVPDGIDYGKDLGFSNVSNSTS